MPSSPEKLTKKPNSVQPKESSEKDVRELYICFRGEPGMIKTKKKGQKNTKTMRRLL